MFETCVNRNSSVSALRDGGFRIEQHIAGAACRTRMRRKRLSLRPNFRAGTLVAHATPLKRLHRHDFPRQTTRAEAAKGRRLPPVRRNMPGFRRKTPLVRASSRHVP
jgi:hypothetical protein